jgi:hypothetical protein
MRQSNARMALSNVLPVILTFIRIIPSMIIIYRTPAALVRYAVNECKQICRKWRELNPIRGGRL